jgi:hypothetical protein
MFDRTFFHLDEYGASGPGCLPSVLCLNRATVLWSPSPLLLQQGFDQGRSIVGPKELLALLRRRDVRIIGRAKWFDRGWRNRKDGWPLAKWQDSFDNEVLRMANEDSALPLTERRVIVASDETGFSLAEKLLAKRPLLRSDLQERFQQRRLPQGIYEKAHRAQREGRPVETQILRDTFNHQSAIVEAQARTATVTDAYMAALISIAHLQPKAKPRSPAPADPADLREAIDLLRAVTSSASFSHLDKLIKSQGRSDLIALLCSERAAGMLADHVVARIEKATEIKPMLDRLFPSRDPIGLSLSLGSMVAMLASVLASSVPFGMMPIGYTVGKGWLQRRGLVPLDVDEGSKVRVLFQLAYGTKRPTKGKVEALIATLRTERMQH